MALTEGPIRGRAKELSTAMELLRARSSIDILGVRMSGRSTFLREIGKRLDSIGVDHLMLSGVTSFRSHNFGTLMAAGIFPHYDKSIPVTRAIDALASQLSDGHTAILVDNWDAMDELSKGVIRVVSDRKGTPIARTRIKTPAFTAQTQSELPPTIEPSLLIEVKPVSAEDLDLILRDYLGAPIDPATTARILSKSGGIVGLALKLTESAVAAKRIVLDGAVWKAKRNLWNSGLYTIVEELLAGLSREARGALEVLSLSGASELSVAKELVHWNMLEELEAHSLIKIYAAKRRYLLTISPPLVVEYFRRSPVSLRRIRHDNFIVQSLGLEEAPPALGNARQVATESDAERDAVFARIVREQEEARSVEIAEAWRQSPTAKNRVEYARSLARVDAAPSEIEAALFEGNTDDSPMTGIPADKALLVQLRAEWRACVLNDLEGALRDLESSREELGDFGRCVDAYSVELQTYLGSMPSDFEARLRVTPDLNETVANTLLRTLALVLSISGRHEEAKETYHQISKSGLAEDDPLLSFILFGHGRVQEAYAISKRGFERAKSSLDSVRCRTHAAILSWILLSDGKLDEARRILATGSSIGGSPRFLREISAQQAIEVSSSILAVRQGRSDAAMAHVSNAETLGMRGPFPMQSPTWARAEYTAYRGDNEGAAELLWDESQRLWNTGAKFAGALALLDSIEFAPSPQRLSYAQTQLESVGTPYLGAYYDYLAFLQKEDFRYTARIARNLQATMHTGLAIKSYQAAAEHFDSRGDEGRASSFEAAVAELKQKHPHVSTGFSESGLRPNLTKRELQIARLVAFGRSNQDIARELTLSIRTIETYVHRIMKKTNSKNRMQVADHL